MRCPLPPKKNIHSNPDLGNCRSYALGYGRSKTVCQCAYPGFGILSINALTATYKKNLD